MKKSSLILLLLSFTTLIFAQQRPITKTQTVKPAERAAESSAGKITLSLFNDFTYMLQEPQPSNTTKGISGANAFVFRRASVGYEYSFNKNVIARVDYDAGSNSLLQAYVDMKNIISMVDLKIGAMQTLSSETVEKIWEYRSLEGNVLDRKGYTHEFDKGLSIGGRSNVQGSIYGNLAFYNGNGVAAENDKLKKIAFSAGSWLDKSSVIEVYADYENRNGGKSTINTKVFYGMSSATMGLGVEGFYRLERKMNTTTGSARNPLGASLYTWMEMMKSFRGLLRVDAVDNDFADTKIGHQELYVNVGFDYLPVPEVHLIPNLIYVKNLKKGVTPEIVDRMEVRLTTAVTLK